MSLEQEQMHRCDHVIRKDKKGRKVRCLRHGAMPTFTRAIHDKPRYPQPRWLCSIHWGMHEEVAFDGRKLERGTFPGRVIHRRNLKAVS